MARRPGIEYVISGLIRLGSTDALGPEPKVEMPTGQIGGAKLVPEKPPVPLVIAEQVICRSGFNRRVLLCSVDREKLVTATSGRTRHVGAPDLVSDRAGHTDRSVRSQHEV